MDPMSVLLDWLVDVERIEPLPGSNHSPLQIQCGFPSLVRVRRCGASWPLGVLTTFLIAYEAIDGSHGAVSWWVGHW